MTKLHPLFEKILKPYMTVPSQEEKKVEPKAHYPAQCNCGHLFLEKYQFNEITDEGYIGFCWCGFCRKKIMVKPLDDFHKEG